MWFLFCPPAARRPAPTSVNWMPLTLEEKVTTARITHLLALELFSPPDRTNVRRLIRRRDPSRHHTLNGRWRRLSARPKK